MRYELEDRQHDATSAATNVSFDAAGSDHLVAKHQLFAGAPGV